jgi:flagellin
MSISLSAGMRTALYSMGDVQSGIDQANKRLATGKKVNDALDNARSYFAAQSFNKEGRDYSSLMDSMDNGLRLVNKTNSTFDSMRKLLESAQSLARGARNLGETDVNRDVIGAQVAEVLNQVAKLAYDAGFNGATLMQTDATVPASTNIVTNISTGTAQTKITLAAVDTRFNAATGIINYATATDGILATTTAGQAQTFAYGGNWDGAGTGNGILDTFITNTTAALTKVQTYASNVSVQATAIQIRQDFTKAYVRNVNGAADYLTLADINEEGANLSALQTKQQLSVQALSLASRADQAILRLF